MYLCILISAYICTYIYIYTHVSGLAADPQERPGVVEQSTVGPLYVRALKRDKEFPKGFD